MKMDQKHSDAFLQRWGLGHYAHPALGVRDYL